MNSRGVSWSPENSQKETVNLLANAYAGSNPALPTISFSMTWGLRPTAIGLTETISEPPCRPNRTRQTCNRPASCLVRAGRHCLPLQGHLSCQWMTGRDGAGGGGPRLFASRVCGRRACFIGHFLCTGCRRSVHLTHAPWQSRVPGVRPMKNARRSSNPTICPA